MSFSKISLHWFEESKKDLTVAEGLFNLKHYSYSLFFCHLSLEKMLKAIYVAKNQEHAPYIHDLVVLAKKASLQLSKKHLDDMETMTSFNIQGRYSDYKSEFYKKYNNRPTAQKYLKITKEYLIWLEKQLTVV